MYISMLFGAAYGVFYGLVLSCLVSGHRDCWKRCVANRLLWTVRVFRSVAVLRALGCGRPSFIVNSIVSTAVGSLED